MSKWKRKKKETVLEKPKVRKKKVEKVEIPEVIVETKPAEPRLICSHCGGELFLLRKSDNQTMYECSKCRRGLSFC